MSLKPGEALPFDRRNLPRPTQTYWTQRLPSRDQWSGTMTEASYRRLMLQQRTLMQDMVAFGKRLLEECFPDGNREPGDEIRWPWTPDEKFSMGPDPDVYS